MTIHHKHWILLMLLHAAPCFPQEPPPAPPIPRGPYLQALPDTSVEIWWSSEPRLPVLGKVIYQREGGEPLVAEEVVAGEEHALKIVGLTPGVRYRYRIFHGEVLMTGDGNTFRTSPPSGDEPI